MGDKSLVPHDLLNEKKISRRLTSFCALKQSKSSMSPVIHEPSQNVRVIHCTMTKHITKCNQLQRQKYTHIHKTTFHSFSGIKSFLLFIILCFEPLIQHRQTCLGNLGLCFIKQLVLLTGSLLSSKDQPLRSRPKRNFT